MWFSILVFLAVSALRIIGWKTAAFQAISHIVFGIFFGIYLGDNTKKGFLWLALALTVVETVMALYGSIK